MASTLEYSTNNKGEDIANDRRSNVYNNEKDSSDSEKYGKDDSNVENYNDERRQPSEEEYASLRHVSESVSLYAWMIVVVELAERFAYYGMLKPKRNYIQQPLPNGSTTGKTVDKGQVAGALGMGLQAAQGLSNFFTFWCFLTPLLFGVIGDTKGRFETICIATVLYIIGLLAITLTSIPQSIASGRAAPLAGVIIASIIAGLGTGGIKSQISVFLGEQTKSTVPYISVTKKGERVIVDPNVTIQRLMHWFYFAINVGSLAIVVAPIIEKYHSYWLTFLVSLLVFLTIPPMLFLLRNKLNRLPPRSSILVETARLIRIVFSQTFSFNPFKWYRNSRKPDNWEVAKPSHYIQSQGDIPKHVTWDDDFVYEVKRALGACVIFLWFVPQGTASSQRTNISSTAATMKQDGTPNDLITVINPIFIYVTIPFLDIILYPFLRRKNIRFGPVARITTGFMFEVLALVYSACIQWYVYKINPCGHFANDCTDGDMKSNISLWAIAPSHALGALAECFTNITAYEISLTKAPVKLKSVITAIFLLQSAFSSAISNAFIPVTKDPYMIWLYGGSAIGYFVIVCIFYITNRHKDKNNEADTAVGKETERTFNQ